MSHDPIHPAGEPADNALSALYQAHLGVDAGDAFQPSAAADARLRALARESVAMARPPVGPAAKPSESGWRSWINASWFKPSLAFATLASLSVIIVALMPRDDLNVERGETASTMSAQAPLPAPPAPSAAPAPAPSAARDSAASSSASSAPAATADASVASAAGSAVSGSTVPGSASSQGAVASKQAVRESAAPRPQASPAKPLRQEAPAPAAIQPPAAEPVPLRSKARMAEQPAAASERAASVPAAPASPASPAPAFAPQPAPPASSAAAAPPASQAPNPFPAQQPMATDRRADKSVEAGGLSASPPPAKPSAPPPPSRQSMALGAAADAAPAAPRVEKPSLQSEPAEFRANSQPLPEVRDSAPTYPHEAQPSGTQAHAPALRRQQQPAPGYASELARSQSTLSAARKEEALQKRAYEGTSPMTVAPPRNPAEWIRTILRLKSEGKNEQVLKELVEFRKHYPAYPLPDELKPLAAAK